MALKDRLKNISYENTPTIVEETSFADYITEALSQKIATIPVWYDYDYSKQFELILNFLDSKLNSEFEDLNLSESEKKAIAENFLKSHSGFGILDKLIAKDEVDGISVNSLGSVYIEVNGVSEKTDLVLSGIQFKNILSRFDNNDSIIRVRQDNLSITIVRPPISDCLLVIRKIKDVYDTISDLAQSGKLPNELKNFLKYLISERKNILLSGSSDNDINEFIQVIMNSIDKSKRINYIEDSGFYKPNMDNINAFSVASIDEFDYEYLLSVISDLHSDYDVCQVSDYKKFMSYYLNIDDTNHGLITKVKAESISDVTNKLINLGMVALKSTEKQAKLKISSVYDYVIYLDNPFRISSIMEITSSKTSSLILNEVVKLVDGTYVLDLSEEILNNEDLSYESDSPRKGFRSRLKDI